MNENPILIFPKPIGTARKKLTARPTKVHFPPVERQVERLEPQFKMLQDVFKKKNLDILSEPTGAQPEHVLVLETVGTIKDFFKAVKKIDGMEWLAEWEEQFDADEDFFKEKDADSKEKPLGGRLFLVMANQTALTQLLSLWKRFKDGKKQEFGLAKWNALFLQVRNIRTWDITDRIQETGVLDEWKERVKAGEETIKFETELWFRHSKEERQATFSLIKKLIEKDGGQILQQAVIPEIAYHAILAELPIDLIGQVLDYTKIQVLKCQNVMFIRPVGQTSVALPELDYFDACSDEDLEQPSGEPIIALLDGLPLEKHTLLDGRIIIDDPDNWSADYRPSEQFHGTAMASLILHGELDQSNPPLKTPLYVRPILKPDENDWRTVRSECIPENVLPIDLIHMTIKRIFDGTNQEPPVAPSVRIINLSIGDRARLFDRALSPWAKLLDWLAYEYNVLFVVSAGNHNHDIVLDIPRSSLSSLTDDELQKETVKAISDDARNRRLLSPSEAINVLTIGALHTDNSIISNLGTRKNVYQTDTFPSPINALGLGYRRSTKPDVLLPGGKQLFTEKPGTTHDKASLCVNGSLAAPGQKVATVGSMPGELSNTCYTRGTSNAAALATRAAASIYETIQELRENQDGGVLLSDRYTSVLIKALLVHSAKWGSAPQQFKEIFSSIQNFKEHLSRFYGYGAIELPRVLECTDHRGTLIGCGSISDGEAHVFNIPLPPSLSGKKIWRRLTVTLAWLTPINPYHQAYRRAALWFDPPKSKLQIGRTEADGRAVVRGTVQHELLEGEKATAFVDGDNLEIKVNCRAEAGELAGSVQYALAVSLEVSESIEIPIYQEIRERVLVKIRAEVSS